MSAVSSSTTPAARAHALGQRRPGDQHRAGSEQHERHQVGDLSEQEADGVRQRTADGATLPAEVEDEAEEDGDADQAEADRVELGLLELGQPHARQPKPARLRSARLAAA